MSSAETYRDAALTRLRDEQRTRNEQTAHINADEVLCDLLTSLGYGDVVAEWRKVEKSY